MFLSFLYTNIQVLKKPHYSSHIREYFMVYARWMICLSCSFLYRLWMHRDFISILGKKLVANNPESNTRCIFQWCKFHVRFNLKFESCNLFESFTIALFFFSFLYFLGNSFQGCLYSMLFLLEYKAKIISRTWLLIKLVSSVLKEKIF